MFQGSPSRILSATAILLFAVSALHVSHAREWTSADGSKTIEAEIISVDLTSDTVTLKGPDGRTFDSPIAAFAPEDRETIRAHQPSNEPEDQPLPETAKRLLELSESNFTTAKDAGKVLPFLNSDSHHALRRFAARASGSIPSPELVAPLIALLDDRVATSEAHDSLVRLTGQDLGKNRTAWEGWWEKNRKAFRPACLTLRELASRRAKENRKKPDPDPDSPQFYGRELMGQNILFLLDISGSMEGARVTRLKMELKSMVDLLPGDATFAFIFFPHQTFPEDGLGTATIAFKEKAQKAIDDIAAGGGTPMGRALDAAFDLVDGGAPVDTIYLLSDGEPSDLSPIKIRQLVSDRNATHYVVVNTIAIGDDSKLLKSIASENGGIHLWSATKTDIPNLPKLAP